MSAYSRSVFALTSPLSQQGPPDDLEIGRDIAAAQITLSEIIEHIHRLICAIFSGSDTALPASPMPQKG
ncbi:MAG: hypothetical protein ABS58_11370 [Mesorhizobium sp. SCN 65-20]|nr:MAG: hypothetical protein ABS58_11370 [Mesorhizobium sp. SCN 65-20]